MSEYYEHPAYSMIDHQIDPLLDVCREWIHGMGVEAIANRREREAMKRETAESLADLLKTVAALVVAEGTPAEPVDVYCETCHAEPGDRCWDQREYPPLRAPGDYCKTKHPHRARVSKARDVTKAQAAWV
jgi:hypothetical protein